MEKGWGEEKKEGAYVGVLDASADAYVRFSFGVAGRRARPLGYGFRRHHSTFRCLFLFPVFLPVPLSLPSRSALLLLFSNLPPPSPPLLGAFWVNRSVDRRQTYAWAETARTVLSLHALREVGRDDKDLQQLLLGGGVNPVNNKDPKAMLTEADRKVTGECV